MNEASKPQPAPSNWHRAWLLLLFLVLAGMPAMIAGNLLRGRDARAQRAVRGDQPGGQIQGKLKTRLSRTLASVEVELWSRRTGQDDVPLRVVRCNALGDFDLEAPPIEQGCYVIRVDDPDYLPVSVETGMLTQSGREIQAPFVELKLERAASVELDLTALVPKPARAIGRVRIVGRSGAGLLRGPGLPVSREETFSGPTLRVERLPAMLGRLILELDDGREIEMPFRVEEGETFRSRIEL